MGIKSLINMFALPDILLGMKTTIKHMLAKENTEEYPHVKRPMPKTYRGILSLLRYEDGTERCVGCCLCESFCPSNCIRVDSDEYPGINGRRWAKEYTIDIRKCIFCGYCVEACPVNALAMTPNYEESCTNKEDLFYNKEKLLKMGEAYPERTQQYLDAHRMGELSELVPEYPFPTW